MQGEDITLYVEIKNGVMVYYDDPNFKKKSKTQPANPAIVRFERTPYGIRNLNIVYGVFVK